MAECRSVKWLSQVVAEGKVMPLLERIRLDLLACPP